MILRSELRKMADTVSPARNSTAASQSRQDSRLLFTVMTGAVLLVLAVAVIALRLYRLTEIPPGLFFDEGANGLDAIQVLQGKHTVFFPGNNGREGLVVYLIALSTSIFGHSILAIRLPTALASAGTVFVVFWLGQLLFGYDERGRAAPWRGLLIGSIGAALLAFSLGYTAIGRTVLRGNLLPGLLCLSIALLWQGWKSRTDRGGTWWQIALAGVCLGLVPYTYIASRFVPVLFFFFGLSFLLPFRPDTWQRVRAQLPRIALFFGAAALVAAPILLYFVLHPEHFFLRSRHLWVLDQDRSLGEPLKAVLHNVWVHLQVFGFRGDPHWRHNFGSQPLLNPVEAIYFWFGVGMALWGWQRPGNRLLLLWLGVMLLPAMLARDDLVPHFLRMIGAAPAIYLLIGVGVWEAWRLLRERSLAFQRQAITIAAGTLICSIVLVQGVLTYRSYFHNWAEIPELYELYESELGEAASVLNKQMPAEETVYLLPYRVNGHPSFEYLYEGAAPAHIIQAKGPDLAPRIEAILSTLQDPTVKVLDWKNDSFWTGDGDENIIALLSKYGRYVDSNEFTNFRIHTYADLALDRPWTFYEALEPLTVRYDGGIELLGVALGQGGEQFSAREQLHLDRSRTLWLGLRWQTKPGLVTDFAVSLRLHGEDGTLAYQNDAVLGNSDFARTSLWSEEETVDTLFHLDLREELPPGDYELRLIVYDTETLTPTVETDVWEPEKVIARLRLTELQ